MKEPLFIPFQKKYVYKSCKEPLNWLKNFTYINLFDKNGSLWTAHDSSMTPLKGYVQTAGKSLKDSNQIFSKN